MPLRSNATLFNVLNANPNHTRPFTPQLQEWRYETQENPKLEDFMGCCYSNTTNNSQDQEHKKGNNNNNVNVQVQVQPQGDVSQTSCYSYSPFNGAPISEFKTWLRRSQPMAGPTEAVSLVIAPVEAGNKRGLLVKCPISASDGAIEPRKSIDTFGQRTSQFRGVTRHRWTGRYEAHLWDNSCRKEGQTRKGRQ
ncbi:hypothetical protein KSS87_009889, partial [Heliosperma pusillum]